MDMSKATDKSLQDVTEQALQAAQLATEAAHEAEAAIAARNDAAVALGKTAQLTRLMAMGTAAASVLMLALGGVFWARSASNLSQAAEVQASASAAFVENLMQMNDALTKLEAVMTASQANVESAQASLDVVIAQLDQRVEGLVQEVGEKLTSVDADTPQNSAILVALAEVELNLTRQLADMTLAPRASASPATLPAAVAPAPAAVKTPPAAPRPTSARTAAPPPNPFRFP
jgi:hypothetical protein